MEEAARFGEVVLVAIPFGRYQSLPQAPLAGKVVVDAMNYYPQRDGLIDFGSLTSSELAARHLSESRLVKAFNTMYFDTLATAGKPGAPEAKAVVSRLVEELGFAPVDTGSLHDSSRQEPGAPIYNRPMTAPEARRILGGEA